MGPLSPPFAKAGDIKSHSPVCLSVRQSVCLSVTKTLTWLISSEVLMIEHWYLACTILVTSPFYWYHEVTLTLTFDLLQGQICCRAGDHNSSNLLVPIKSHHNDPKMKVDYLYEQLESNRKVILRIRGKRYYHWMSPAFGKFWSVVGHPRCPWEAMGQSLTCQVCCRLWWQFNLPVAEVHHSAQRECKNPCPSNHKFHMQSVGLDQTLHVYAMLSQRFLLFSMAK